jgi:hypothetical protein
LFMQMYIESCHLLDEFCYSKAYKDFDCLNTKRHVHYMKVVSTRHKDNEDLIKICRLWA